MIGRPRCCRCTSHRHRRTIAYRDEALGAPVWREDHFGYHAAGGAGVRGASHAGRLRTQDDRPHPRCLERRASHCGEVGSRAGQSRTRSRPANTQDGAAQMGVDDGPGSGTTGRFATTRQGDGRRGNADGTQTRRVVCAPVEGHESGQRAPDRAGGGLRGCFRYAENGCRYPSRSAVGGASGIARRVAPSCEANRARCARLLDLVGQGDFTNNVSRRSIFPACARLGFQTRRG